MVIRTQHYLPINNTITMRNIKFRGRTAEGEWVYGYFVMQHYNKPIVRDDKLVADGEVVKALIYNDTSKDKSYWTEVERESVGEFTGLYDSKGREIYEGDIIKTQWGNNGVVTWHKHGYFFFDTVFGYWNLFGYWNQFDADIAFKYWNQFNDYAPLGKIIDTFINDKKVQMEVIGNIYDNPELLKEETLNKQNQHNQTTQQI